MIVLIAVTACWLWEETKDDNLGGSDGTAPTCVPIGKVVIFSLHGEICFFGSWWLYLVKTCHFAAVIDERKEPFKT